MDSDGNCQFRAISFGLYGARYCLCLRFPALEQALMGGPDPSSPASRFPSSAPARPPQGRRGTTPTCGARPWPTCSSGGATLRGSLATSLAATSSARHACWGRCLHVSAWERLCMAPGACTRCAPAGGHPNNRCPCRHCHWCAPLRAPPRRQMLRDGTWGDELTLRAACEALGVVVNVLTSGACLRWPGAPAGARAIARGRARQLRSRVPDRCPPPRPPADENNWFLRYLPQSTRPSAEIFVTYIAPIHYNAIR